MKRTKEDRGAALVLCLLAMVLMMVIGAGLVLATSTEILIAGNFRRGAEARAAAAAIVERALADLNLAAGWNDVLSGAARSTFSDGSPGVRSLPDGSSLDLERVINQANCGSQSGCTSGQMDGVSAGRPWGMNNPRWLLYASGSMSGLLPGDRITSTCYAIALVADDQSETDGNPLVDGVAPDNPGAGVLVLRGESFCGRGARHGLELTVRRGAFGTRVVSWRERDRLDRP